MIIGNTSMRLRKLRIAWSVACGIACVLLIALWMRSGMWGDQLGYCYASAQELTCRSINGRLQIDWGYNPFSEADAGEWLAHSLNIDEIYGDDHPEVTSPIWAFDIGQGFLSIAVPHWSLFVVVVAVGTLPWIRWRFSLRTLLIATTLVAVALGLAAYATR
jgi:hypothetical protein